MARGTSTPYRGCSANWTKGRGRDESSRLAENAEYQRYLTAKSGLRVTRGPTMTLKARLGAILDAVASVDPVTLKAAVLRVLDVLEVLQSIIKARRNV